MNAEPPSVSVVTTTHQRGAPIAGTLREVLELVAPAEAVVDDGSTNSTGEVREAWPGSTRGCATRDSSTGDSRRR